VLRRNVRDPHVNLGNVYYVLKKPELAITEYKAVLDVPAVAEDDSNHVVARNNLVQAHFVVGSDYLQQNKPDLAVTELMAVLEPPATPETHDSRQAALTLLTVAFLNAGQLDEALVFLRRVPRSEFDSALKLNNLGVVLWGKADFAGAARFYREAVRLEPKVARYHINLATALEDEGKKEEAAAEVKAGLALDPEWPKTARALAWKRATDPDQRQRNAQEALLLARQALLASAEATPELLDTLAAAHAGSGKFAEAVRNAQQAAELAADAKNTALEQQIRARLDLYKKKQPYTQRPTGS
jgi:tetratricopeptide (TPR) repeat protein